MDLKQISLKQKFIAVSAIAGFLFSSITPSSLLEFGSDPFMLLTVCSSMLLTISCILLIFYALKMYNSKHGMKLIGVIFALLAFDWSVLRGIAEKFLGFYSLDLLGFCDKWISPENSLFFNNIDYCLSVIIGILFIISSICVFKKWNNKAIIIASLVFSYVHDVSTVLLVTLNGYHKSMLNEVIVDTLLYVSLIIICFRKNEKLQQSTKNT